MSLLQPIPIIPSVATLASSCDAWISDIWGVLHNGRRAWPAAAEACRRYRQAGGTVVLVTNAPKLAGEVAARLDQLGVPRDAWDAMVTSGDVTRGLIAPYAGRPVWHLGPDHDRGLFAGLNVELAPLERAEVVVCTGLFEDETETPDDYRETLAQLRTRNLELICVNPDIVVERGERLVYCAGALAEAYEQLGGRVAYAGKPHLPIYERALELVAEARGGKAPARERLLAIGDGLRTDIAGAQRLGVRSLFIASALTLKPGENLSPATLVRLFPELKGRPVAAQAALTW